MKTLHVVGFKDSGKTTLISRWVRLLKRNGFTVAVLKHHGHSEPLALPDAKTDSMQYLLSGADVSVVAGGGAMQLHMNDEPDFHRMKEIATLQQPDILLVEGYKDEQGEKVVLLREEEDWATLQSLQGIRLVFGADLPAVDLTSFETREDADQLDRWLLNWMQEG